MTNGLRNHPGPVKIRSWADEQRYNRNHRLFWRAYWIFLGLTILTISALECGL